MRGEVLARPDTHPLAQQASPKAVIACPWHVHSHSPQPGEKSGLAWSEEHGYIDRSSMSAGIMPEIDTDAPGREPSKPEEIVKLFSSAPFTTQRSDEPSAFWLPLLGLYTGARIEE